MVNPIRNIIMIEFLNNEIVKLQDLYKIVDDFDDPSRNKTQKHHLVRSILDSNRRAGHIIRIAPETYRNVEKSVYSN
jgi:hypothetical protein